MHHCRRPLKILKYSFFCDTLTPLSEFYAGPEKGSGPPERTRYEIEGTIGCLSSHFLKFEDGKKCASPKSLTFSS